MKVKDIKWCPQHGYPLPCDKCGMPLSNTQQREVYELGRQAGIKETVEWLRQNNLIDEGQNSQGHPTHRLYLAGCRYCEWQAKLKEWGIKEVKDGS